MREFKGKKYDREMTTKEIGRKVKKYIKENFGNKNSVRTTYDTISIKIDLKEDNFAKTREEISDIGVNYKTRVLDELERQEKPWTDTNIENYLKETKVPNNYKVESEKITFKLSADETSRVISIANIPVVPVKNTAASTSIIIIAAGAVLMIGGVGALIFLKKKEG